MSGDSKSPDAAAPKPRAPRKTAPKAAPKAAPVKVVKKAPAKKPQKTAPPKAPSRARKPAPAAVPAEPAAAPVKPKAPRKKPGSTALRNPVDLSKKALEALQVANLHGLDERQAKFIDLWLVTQHATQSYLDAGFECASDASAAAAASRLLRKVREHPYLLTKRAELYQRTAEVQERVINRIYGAAMADPRDISEYIYTCCRHCHGVGHRYQMTPRQIEERQEEYQALVDEAKATRGKKPKPLDMLGGGGFDARRDPHPDCPECHGIGLGRMYIKDTRHLSPASLGIFGGIKQTKDGIEAKVWDQRPYLEMMARLYNMDIEPKADMVLSVDKDGMNEILQRAKDNTQMQRDAMSERARQIAALDAEDNA